jgi:hypothetical protein
MLETPTPDQLQPSSFNPSRGQLRDSDAPILISHEKQPPLEAHQYFSRHGTASELVANVFTPDSRWAVPADLTFKLSERSPTEAMDHYLSKTREVYTLAQESIAAINWFGYNDHGPLHIQRVCEAALEFGSQANFTVPEMRRLIAASAFHDLGNLVSRDNHSWESPEIALAMFPELRDEQRGWAVIERAIQAHELGTHKIFLKDGSTKEAAQSRVKAIRDILGDEAIALIMADKIQFTRERVNDRALTPEAIFAHRYSQLSLYWETSSARYVPENKSFVWQLNFRPEIFGHELGRFGKLAASDSNDPAGAHRVVLPPAFSEQGLAPFEAAHELFWDLSKKLVRRFIECSFALFDARGTAGMESFTLRFVDDSRFKDSRNHYEHRFTLHDLDTSERLKL